ncbi:hypothetical protein [Nannocystis radixulma]|uniref:Beta-propeller repeat-containing protein n=1 Tax=Nannocystis radixulma TaxID=2995305 RepID=A0ABT5AYW0_9BACT|nr:hypothetical protein [Nannocystis radixulma]MDC0667031.1 hypothetical protein [Nannocystis radixulma]
MTQPRPFILPVLLLTLDFAGCTPEGNDGTAGATEPDETSTTTAASTQEPTGEPTGTSGPSTSTSGDDDTTTSTTSTTSTSTTDPVDDTTSSSSTTGSDDSTTTAPDDTSTSTSGGDDTTTTTGATGPDDTTTTTGTTGPDDDTTTTGGDPECGDGVAWVRHIPNHAKARLFNKVVVDAGDNLFAVGNFWQTADFGGGPLEAGDPTAADGFLVKYGPQGEHLWTRQFGGVDEQRLYGVAVDGGGDIVVAGKFRGTLVLGDAQLQSAGLDDGFVARLDPSGVPLWSQRFGGAGDDSGLKVAVDGAGDVVLTARSTGPLDFGDGPLGQGVAVHVVRFDPGGALLWHRAYDAQLIDARGVAVGPDDAVVVAGDFKGSCDFGAGPVNSQIEGNVFVLKLDPDGDLAWSVVSNGVGEFGSPSVTGVAIDGAGRIHLGGWFTGEIGFGGPLVFTEGQLDAWVATLSPSGAQVSISGHGSGPNTWQMIHDVAADAAGRTAVAGSFQGTIAFGDDILALSPGDTKFDAFAARFDEDGVPIEARGFGALGEQFGDVIALGADGSAWLAGSFRNTFELGGETLSVTEYDGYVARLCP